MTATTPQEVHRVDANEFIETLTGFDEIAIEKHFGSRWGTLAEQNPTMLLRALVFIEFRREGQSDPDAYKAALSLTLREAQDRFPDAEEEFTPDEPETEGGKDDSASNGTPMSSPLSASSPDSPRTLTTS